jgi:hypothetical protein
MSSFVFTDGYISIASNVISSDGRSATVNYSAEQQDDTAFGDTTRSRLGGLKDWTIDLEFNQDHAASHVDAVMFSLVGTVVAVEIRPTSGSRSPTNPGYNGQGLIASYSPVGAGVGETAKARVQVVAAGTLARSTS